MLYDYKILFQVTYSNIGISQPAKRDEDRNDNDEESDDYNSEHNDEQNNPQKDSMQREFGPDEVGHK